MAHGNGTIGEGIAGLWSNLTDQLEAELQVARSNGIQRGLEVGLSLLCAERAAMSREENDTKESINGMHAHA